MCRKVAAIYFSIRVWSQHPLYGTLALRAASCCCSTLDHLPVLVYAAAVKTVAIFISIQHESACTPGCKSNQLLHLSHA